jgi:hypothetical protein
MGLNLEPVPENRAQKKRIAAVLAFVAAAALLFCAASRRWMDDDGGDAGFGPRGWSCDVCRGELAGDKSNGELVQVVREYRQMMRDRGVPSSQIVKAPSKLFPIAGYAAFACCVLSAIALIAGGVIVLRGGVPTRPAALAVVALFLTLGSGMTFMATNPLRDKGMSPVTPGWIFVLFGAAVVSGIVAAQMLIKLRKLEPGDTLV